VPRNNSTHDDVEAYSLACDRSSLKLVHSKVPVQVHSMVPVPVQVHSMVPVPVQVHSMLPLPEHSNRFHDDVRVRHRLALLSSLKIGQLRPLLRSLRAQHR
jgi:hypothetical protein